MKKRNILLATALLSVGSVMERIRKIFSKSREQAKLEVAKMLSERNAR